MKHLISLGFTACAALFLLVPAQGQESQILIRMREQYLIPKPVEKAASLDIVVMPPFPVEGKIAPKISYRTARAVEELFEVRRNESPVQIVSSPLVSEHGPELSPIREFSLRLPELKLLKNGVEVSGLGTVYVRSGIRWRVDKDNPHLTRAIVPFHGGPMIQQSYDFRGGHDLFRKFFKTPIEKFLSRFD